MDSGVGGRRVLIVGASSGIGSGLAVELSRAGADVALAARRVDRLHAVAEQCQGRTAVIPCDVRSARDCRSVVSDCLERLGGLDALVYAAGMAKFGEATDVGADDWRSVLETNVIGAALVTAAAVGHLTEAAGHAVYLTSVSARYLTPWRGMATYMASKRALESLVESLRHEHRSVAFTTFVIGPTASEFGMDDLDNMARFSADWARREQLSFTEILQPSDHARMLIEVLSSDPRTCITEVVVQPR